MTIKKDFLPLIQTVTIHATVCIYAVLANISFAVFYITHKSPMRIYTIASRKHAYIISTPLNSTFLFVKLGFTGVYIIFLISAQKHRLWVLIGTASSRRFQRVPTIYVLSRNVKNIRFFYTENFHFSMIKFSIYFNRHVFVID